MSQNTKVEGSTELTASLLATAIRQSQGLSGVLVRDLVNLNPAHVLRELQSLQLEGVDLRIAYLNNNAQAVAAELGFSAGVFTTHVEQAELWRNQAGLDALIVVIAEEDAAKLTSLEEFGLIAPPQLRNLLVESAVSYFGEFNEVLPRWWAIIGRDDQIAFFDLVDYYLALKSVPAVDLKEAAAQQINRLGLLPDPGFFDNPTDKQLRARLEENRDLALRLANFSEEDRQRVDAVLDSETDVARRLELKQRLRDLQTYRRGGSLGLTASDAQKLLRIRRKPLVTPGPSKIDDKGRAATLDSNKTPPNITMLAVESLLETTKDDQDADLTDGALDSAVHSLREQLDEMNDDATVRPRPVKVELPSGAELAEEIQTDVLNLMRHVISEQKLGGLVESIGADTVSMVRNFQQSPKSTTPWDVEEINELLAAFAGDDAKFLPIREAFDSFISARAQVLPYLGELTVAPLLVATAPASRSIIEPVVATYQELISKTEALYGALHQRYGDDARALVELLLLIDTVYLQSDDAFVAIMTPLNPLLLWHYVEYTKAIESQRGMLAEKDQNLVRSEFERANGVPLFLASLGVPRRVADAVPSSLPFSGKLGNLPHFSLRSSSRDHKDGIGAIGKLIEAFIALYPASSEGLRIALLDPPDSSVYLSLVCDLADSGVLSGAHITVLRRVHSVKAELNLSSEEERRVQQRFGDHDQRRFTFGTVNISSSNYGVPDGVSAHILVVFDQTEGQSSEAGGATQAIQPLANRRRIAYRISAKSLDLEPALGGILAAYSSFAKLAVGTNIVSYQAIHQSKELQERFRVGARTVPWYVVADAHIDRDLELGGLRVLTTREGTRDVTAFTRSPDAFRRSLRDVVRQFNTVVSDDTLDELLAALSELLDAGLLSLRPGKTGDTLHAHVKGILGLLVAVQSLRETTPLGYERMILSLDDTQARRWLHLSDDPHRADLLVIDGVDDGFVVTIVEVKTRLDSAGEYSLKNGQVSGPAIQQLLSTYRLLDRVFAAETPDVLLTPSRREVLREHLYRELSKSRYDSDAKKRWAGLSQKLFDGSAEVDLRTEIVNVQLGLAATSLDVPHEATTVDGDKTVRVTIRHLNEDGVPVLEDALRQLEEVGVSIPGKLAGPGPAVQNPPRQGPEHSGDAISTETVGSARLEADAPGHSVPVDRPLHEVDSGRPRVFVGTASNSGGQPREVWYDPQKPTNSLNNPHISISGETGSGKTQATKAILRELKPHGIPSLILDFKDDYSKSDYAAEENFTVHDASFGALPFNPMVPPIDPVSGRANPVGHVHELANMLQRIYKLGDQQTFQLREAMKETYADAGVGIGPFVPEPNQKYLSFEAVRDVLVREEANTLLGRLSPIFDLSLFSEGGDDMTLDSLLNSPTVIRLSQLPGEQVKNAVAEFFLMALYNFLIRRQQPHQLERVLVLDEAWRLVGSPFLEPLMREGRAFGLGVILATQFPRDLPDSVSGSTATRLYFSQTKAEQIREVQKTLVGKTSGSEAEHIGNLMRGLTPLECIFQNNHYKPWIRLKATPYYALSSRRTP